MGYFLGIGTFEKIMCKVLNRPDNVLYPTFKTYGAACLNTGN